MTIFINSMKRIFRNKALLAVMLLLPFLPMIPIVTQATLSDKELRLGIVDLDQTQLIRSLIKSLDSNCKIFNVKEDEIWKGLAYSRLDYGLVIQKGYTEGIILGKNPILRGYAKKEMDVSKLIGLYVDNYMNPVKNIAKMSEKSSEIFYSRLENYNDGSFSIKTGSVKRNKTEATAVSWGMVVMFMMFSATYAATQLLTDKENRTFFRTLSAPVSTKNYMFQRTLSYLFVSILQVTVLVPALVFVFDVYPGISTVNIYLLFVVFSLVAVSLGIAISSFVKNVITGSVIGVGISLITCMLGGAWGSLSNADLLNSFGKMLPTYWMMDGVSKLLDDGSLSMIGSNIVILLIFASIFFLLGTWKKADIAK